MRDAVIAKWEGTRPYFENSLKYLVGDSFVPATGAKEGEAFCYYGVNTFVSIPDVWLVEAVAYENDTMHVMAIKRAGSKLIVQRYARAPSPNPSPISVSLICTENEPYRTQLIDAVAHYSTLPNVGEVTVAYYGSQPPYSEGMFQNDKIHGFCFPPSMFSMARARNASLSLCSRSRVLVSDLDYRFTAEQIEELQEILQDQSTAVINLKARPSDGNGNYFGLREVLEFNSYDERFTGFWREDTEYLMNFSRLGIVPLVVIRDAYKHPAQDHSRHVTGGSSSHNNFELMQRIIHHGR